MEHYGERFASLCGFVLEDGTILNPKQLRDGISLDLKGIKIDKLKTPRVEHLRIVDSEIEHLVTSSININLVCIRCNIKSITFSDSSGLKLLNCSFNKITELNLPKGLVILDCSNNNISEISIPNSLKEIHCFNSGIKELTSQRGLRIFCRGNGKVNLEHRPISNPSGNNKDASVFSNVILKHGKQKAEAYCEDLKFVECRECFTIVPENLCFEIKVIGLQISIKTHVCINCRNSNNFNIDKWNLNHTDIVNGWKLTSGIYEF